MLKAMVGNTEIQSAVSDIQRQLPEMQSRIAEQVVEMVKQEVLGAIKAHTLQTDRKLDGIIEIVKEQSNPTNVVKAIEQSEEDKERERIKKSITRKLSEVYTIEKESNLLTETKGGRSKLTKDGQRMYDLFSQTVLDIAKLHGSKSHMKVVNRTVYEEFGKTLRLGEDLTKKIITFNNGTNRESVYADIIERGLLGKFAKFIEYKYVLNA